MLSVHDINVEESLDGVNVVCPETSLQKTESMVCNATYPLTQASLLEFEKLDRSSEAAERLASRRTHGHQGFIFFFARSCLFGLDTRAMFSGCQPNRNL